MPPRPARLPGRPLRRAADSPASPRRATYSHVGSARIAASYSFGNQNENTSSAASTFTVTNHGTTPLTFQTLTGTDTGNDFPVTADNCAGATLNQGDTNSSNNTGYAFVTFG
jgi:hypothetical protein